MTNSAQSDDQARFLTYAERKRLAAEGTLGPLVVNELPRDMLPGLRALVPKRTGRPATPAAREMQEHLGHYRFVETCLLRYGAATPIAAFERFLANVDEMLGFFELAYRDLDAAAGPSSAPVAARWLETDINKLFRIHRMGYEMRAGLMYEIPSPALAQEVIGPALLIAAGVDWHQVEIAYHKALIAFREERVETALTQAVAAVEAALKAAGVTGGTLEQLLKHLKGAPWLVGNDAGTAQKVCDLIERMLSWRPDGDAHGLAPDAAPATRARAALAIHWAGAVIVYVHECWSARV